MNVHHVVEALGILVAGVLFYSYTYNWFPPGHPQRDRWWTAVIGLSFGGLAVVLMIARIEIERGVFVDARLIPVALVGLFEGWRIGLLAALVGSAYRVWLGGSGMWVGVAGLVATGLAAGALHRWAGGSERVQPRHFAVLAGLTFTITLWSFALLGTRGWVLFSRVWVPYLVMLVVGIVVFGRLFFDVVQQHQLRAAQQRFRAILDEATDAIRIVDPDTGRILDCNHADCELSGYPPGEMIGRDVRDFWPEEPGLRARREADAAEARLRGFARTLDLPLRRASGEIISVDSTRRVVEYQGRRYEIVIFRDARDRLAAEVARREAAELRSVTMLAQAAAHEINNPLAVITGYLEMLASRAPAGSQESRWLRLGLEGAGRIREAVGRLSRIVRIEPTQPGGGVPPILDTEKSSAPPEESSERAQGAG